MQLNGGKAENRKYFSVVFCHNIVGSELLDTVFTLVIIKPKFYTHSCYPSTFFYLKLILRLILHYNGTLFQWKFKFKWGNLSSVTVDVWERWIENSLYLLALIKAINSSPWNVHNFFLYIIRNIVIADFLEISSSNFETILPTLFLDFGLVFEKQHNNYIVKYFMLFFSWCSL